MVTATAESTALTPVHIAEVARPIALRHGFTELYLFGSQANGTSRPDSDIDFIYAVSSDADRSASVQGFRTDIREALGRDVDMVRKGYLTDPIEDRLASLQRDYFLDSLMRSKVYRLLPRKEPDHA